MSFWIYENFGAKRARIHTGDCRYCNHGEGVGGNKDNDDDAWHGPFDTFSEAEAKAKSLNQKDTKPCGACKPASAEGRMAGASVAPAVSTEKNSAAAEAAIAAPAASPPKQT